MPKLLIRLLLFSFVLYHAELVSASVGAYHKHCGLDVSASVCMNHKQSGFYVSTFNWTFHKQDVLSFSRSFEFDETLVLKDSLKQATHDSIKADTVYHHSYKRAALWSTFIPGAGQIYNEFGYRKIPQKKNRAWWKVPIIYGLLGTAGYYFRQYTVTSKRLKDEWIYRNDSLGTYLYDEYIDWDADQLLDGTTTYKLDGNGAIVYDNNGNPIQINTPGFDTAAKRRDLLIFGFAAIWGLQIVEALVDAHFVTFDVSEDLTFSWSPTLLNYSTLGVTLKLEIN